MSNDIRERARVPLQAVTIDNIKDVFSYVDVGGKMRVVRFVPTAIDSNAVTVKMMTVPEFKNAFLNRRRKILLEKGSKKTVRRTIAELFLIDPSRPIYSGLVFESDPDKVRETDFNTWTGFAVRPRRGSWDKMDRMILASLANEDYESYIYIKRWLAWKIQNPTGRPTTALIFRSDLQGTGKGLLGRAMCNIFGAHSQHIYRADGLTARFNSQLANCAFIFDDESTFSGDKAAANVLKGLITEPTIDIEKKGVDVITLPNAIGLIKATNSKWTAQVESGDRRYAVFDSSNEMANDQTYFGPIVEQMKSGGLEAMLYELSRMDLKGWHPRDDIPNTSARAEQKVLSLNPEDKWILGLLESGVLPGADPRYPSRVVELSEMYSNARSQSPNLRYWSDIQFVNFLKGFGVELRRSGSKYRDFGTLAGMRESFRTRHPWYEGFTDYTGEWRHESMDATEECEEMDFG